MPNPIANLSVQGTLVNSGSDAHLQFKAYSFANAAVVGWSYPKFLFTLKRITSPGKLPRGAFVADFQVVSSGRHSTDGGAHYKVVLLNNETPLLYLNIGTRPVTCGSESWQFQGDIKELPDVTFNQVNGVRLEMISVQDAC